MLLVEMILNSEHKLMSPINMFSNICLVTVEGEADLASSLCCRLVVLPLHCV